MTEAPFNAAGILANDKQLTGLDDEIRKLARAK